MQFGLVESGYANFMPWPNRILNASPNPNKSLLQVQHKNKLDTPNPSRLHPTYGVMEERIQWESALNVIEV